MANQRDEEEEDAGEKVKVFKLFDTLVHRLHGIGVDRPIDEQGAIEDVLPLVARLYHLVRNLGRHHLARFAVVDRLLEPAKESLQWIGIY